MYLYLHRARVSTRALFTLHIIPKKLPHDPTLSAPVLLILLYTLQRFCACSDPIVGNDPRIHFGWAGADGNVAPSGR
jgi:hypothetical protein